MKHFRFFLFSLIIFVNNVNAIEECKYKKDSSLWALYSSLKKAPKNQKLQKTFRQEILKEENLFYLLKYIRLYPDDQQVVSKTVQLGIEQVEIEMLKALLIKVLPRSKNNYLEEKRAICFLLLKEHQDEWVSNFIKIQKDEMFIASLYDQALHVGEYRLVSILEEYHFDKLSLVSRWKSFFKFLDYNVIMPEIYWALLPLTGISIYFFIKYFYPTTPDYINIVVREQNNPPQNVARMLLIQQIQDVFERQLFFSRIPRVPEILERVGRGYASHLSTTAPAA